jgi:AcrR family transcriptional regulator
MVEGMRGTQHPAIGRPRAFDPDEALDRALQVFWRQGYEGASLSDLTEAMGISRTSMYAAFGNKEDLFRKALERYASGPASYTEKALEQPTARAVAQHLLEGAILTTTARGGPAGCLSVQGALATGAPGHGAREALIMWRRKGENALRERFARARAEGDLPLDADPATLARYVVTLVYGIAVQAATGTPREALRQIIDTALHGWPTHRHPKTGKEPRARTTTRR